MNTQATGEISPTPSPETLTAHHEPAVLSELENAYHAIEACTNLLELFLVDDASEPEIPQDVKNNYIRGGLISAIRIASRKMCEIAESAGSAA